LHFMSHRACEHSMDEQPGSPQPDSPQPDALQPDSPQPDSPQPDSHQPDSPQPTPGEAQGSNEAKVSYSVRYLKRRPLHPGRFFDFARDYAGPMTKDFNQWSDSDSEDEDHEEHSHPAEGSLATVLHAASGCLWFAGSDDVRAVWELQPPTESEEIPRQHCLRGGEPWDPLKDPTGIGQRRVELEIMLFCAASQKEVLEKELLKVLNSCLLTRDEAAALEAGDKKVLGDLEWEDIRCNHFEVRAWTPILKALLKFMDTYEGLPGFKLVARFGNFLVSRVKHLLCGSDCPKHH